MTHAELEAIVTDLEAFEKANNYDATRDEHSPQADSRREFSFHIGQMLVHCNGLGFNPWPAVKPFFETYSISILPEYPAYEEMVVLASSEANKAAQCEQISDFAIFQIYDLSQRFQRVAHAIEAQIQYPVDAKHEDWKSKRSKKGSTSPPQPVVEAFSLPNLPITSREDIENALKELYYFSRKHMATSGELNEFCCQVSHFGMSSSFLGYLPPPMLAKKWKDVSLDDLPDERAVYLDFLNKIYRLYIVVRDADSVTPNQLNRMFRLTWRARKFSKQCGVRLRAIVDAVNWEA